MKALSIRNPWAWLIINAGKDIENRSWPTKFRGRFLVHASAGMTKAEYEYVQDFILGTEMFAGNPHIDLPPLYELKRGGIIGSVDLVDCVRESDSCWYMGEVGFVLRDPRPTPFIPYKGRLGFFDVPDELILEAGNGS